MMGPLLWLIRIFGIFHEACLRKPASFAQYPVQAQEKPHRLGLGLLGYQTQVWRCRRCALQLVLMVNTWVKHALCRAEAKPRCTPCPAVLGRQTRVRGVGGEMFPRTLYHLPSNDSALMLDLREVVKVGPPSAHSQCTEEFLCCAPARRAKR